MGFWIFMLFCNSMIPLTMLLLGAWFAKKPPTGINSVVGYRTKRSMKSQKAWDFAQKYMGSLWKKWGAILFIPSVIATVAVIGQSEDVIGNVTLVLVHVQTVLLIASTYPVERALKANFDEDGKRKR